jgi:chromosome partitioning protein
MDGQASFIAVQAAPADPTPKNTQLYCECQHKTGALMAGSQRIVVLNSKGGCGKTTLATNLAACYAQAGFKTALLDYDPQGSATFWLSRRPKDRAPIQSIPAYKYNHSVTRSWFLRVEPNTERVIVDSPAGLEMSGFQQLLDKADAILIPVLPSDIDIHAASHCIADLLLVAKQHKRRQRIAVIANRVRKNLLVYQKLETFLRSLGIPFVTSLRDTTLYVQASDQGLGIHELHSSRRREDLEHWRELMAWLDQLQHGEAEGTAAL